MPDTGQQKSVCNWLSIAFIVSVAIARAMANVPALLIADEPTGNLDPKTAETVFEQLTTLVHATGLAALIATHNFDLAARMDRTLELRNGTIVAA